MSATLQPSSRLNKKPSAPSLSPGTKTPHGPASLSRVSTSSSLISSGQNRLKKKSATCKNLPSASKADQPFAQVLLIRQFQPLPQAPLLTLPAVSGGKKTLVFDLDETLVHASTESTGVCLVLPHSQRKVNVNVRPFASECLREASSLFEVVVFTASCQEYADVVLDYLDPDHDLIAHRLYRDSCVLVEGTYVKDLSVLDRDLSQVVIVDNSISAFALQLDNGVPIRTWLHDKNDRELLKLMDYLKVLEKSKDVREVNRSKFHLELLSQQFVKTPLKRSHTFTQ